MTLLEQPTTRVASSAATPGSRRLRPPRRTRLRTSDVIAVGGFVGAVTLGLWVVHGGPAALASGGVASLSALGQVSGIVAALAALGGLVLTSRLPWLERRYGQDSLVAAHRWFGITVVAALLIHVVADSWAWGTGVGGNAVTGFLDLLGEPWMVAATTATVLVLAVGLTSWRRLRRRIPYETWYFLHLTGYLAVLLGFAHQLTLGSDFTVDRLAWWWWLGLFVGTGLIVTWSRLADLLRSVTRPLTVVGVTAEARGIGSLHVTGPGVRHMRAAAGQYFNVRILTRDLWWQAHPYSLSAAPTASGLRFTIKALGEGSESILNVRPGTRVLLEGPYGAFTAARAQGRPVVLVAGGVGIAPIRAILADCTPEQRPVVIVRVRHEDEVAHRAELELLCAQRNGRLYVLAGRREWFTTRDPFNPAVVADAIPDIAERDVFVCGPASLESAVMTGMRKAGVPARHIHQERFGV